MSKGYNGYANYETWAVSLWLDNDQGSYNYWTGTAEELYRDAVEVSEQCNRADWTRSAADQLADRLKDELQEVMPEVDGLWADLLGAAFSEVDWYEIAQNYVTNLDQDEIESEVMGEEEEADEPEPDTAA